MRRDSGSISRNIKNQARKKDKKVVCIHGHNRNITVRAQFHRAAKHTNLLSMKSLSRNKQDYQPNLHMIFWISKQQLNTINKQYATKWSLVGKPVVIKEIKSC